MGLASLINMAMLIMAASTFHQPGMTNVGTIEEAHRRSSRCWAARPASSSPSRCWPPACRPSSVGTMAGQVIMQGFLHRHIPLWLRRLVTMVPIADRHRPRPGPHPHAGDQPGGAELRPAVCHHPAGDVHPPQGPHGRAGQQAHHDRDRRFFAILIVFLNFYLLYQTFLGGGNV